MKYKITKVAKDGVTVEFEDGAWAFVPILAEDRKSDILARIPTFATKEVFKSDDAVPLDVGFEADTEDDAASEEEVREQEWTYAEAREGAYPAIGDQLDALFWAREGDDSQLKLLDEQIKAVKAKYPKNDKIYKAEDL
mgnify:FL=1|tara:strand:- start:714 stop:1127 length:414 start_codon:yes stop_codon:yes gene_type:complete